MNNDIIDNKKCNLKLIFCVISLVIIAILIVVLIYNFANKYEVKSISNNATVSTALTKEEKDLEEKLVYNTIHIEEMFIIHQRMLLLKVIFIRHVVDSLI